MKKIFALLLALCMVFALCACGSPQLLLSSLPSRMPPPPTMPLRG